MPVVLTLITLFVITYSASDGQAKERMDAQDRIVAIVNDDVIILSELQREMSPFLPQLHAQFSGKEFQQQVTQLRHKLLVAMIEQKLQLQQAKKMRLTVSDREINSTVQEMRARRGANPASTPTAGERKAAQDQLLLMKVYQHRIRSTLLIPDVVLREYYNAHREEFIVAGEVNISQIMLSINDSGTLQKARLRSQHVLKEIEDGRHFEELAQDYSDGPEAKQGGSLGTMTRGSLLPQIEAVIDRLGPGEIGPAIESPAGIHIIRVNEKTPQSLRPFEEVKETIESKLLRKQSQQAYQAWLNELKDNAFIEIRL